MTHLTPTTAIPRTPSRRLTHPAPSRASTQTGSEPQVRSRWLYTAKAKSTEVEGRRVESRVDQPLFSSHPYGEGDVLRTLSSGGWFDFNNTSFASQKVRQFALDAQRTMEELCHAAQA